MKIHFIGIGGIGVSALAQYYISKGHKVSGSDLVSSEITDYLKEKGARVIIGSNIRKNIIEEIDLVIYSPAVKPDNPELKEAKELKIKTLSYPEALGELTKQYYTIAISGTHGKSTTTAMISLVLEYAGLNPTVIIGTKLKEFGGTNFKEGKSKYLVIEADEHFASFLNYWPKMIVLTNIEKDHLDYYKTLNNILKTFKEYIGHLDKGGILIANADDNNISKIISAKTKKFSIKDKESKKIKEILKVPGQHNVYNALASLAAARALGIPDEISFKALSDYKGAWRRFDLSEKDINGKKITIINDYGHHPTEVLAALKGAREKFPDRKIYCIFQPHQRQRTFYLYKDFIKTFKEVSRLIDKIVVTDIYDVFGRETKTIKISSQKLAKDAKKENVIYISDSKLKKYIYDNLKSKDVLIIMGAGDIYDLNKEL